MPLDVLLITAVVALIEVAGLMLVVRGVFWLFGARRGKGNFFYEVLTSATMPFIKAARKASPRFVRDSYVPAIAFVLLFALWIGLNLGKQALCAYKGLQCTELKAASLTQAGFEA